jgi:hypothetical protein
MEDFVVGKMQKSPLFERRTDIDPADLKRPGARKEYKEEDLLAHLSAEEWVGATEWKDAVREKTGMGERLFAEMRAALHDRGQIEHEKEGSKHFWRKTLAGIQREGAFTEEADLSPEELEELQRGLGLDDDPFKDLKTVPKMGKNNDDTHPKGITALLISLNQRE